ncbi:tail fiber assembly protein [Caballeronia sp. S22]|uniref:tail fiber assembly protein n=1 Tax=Caballeronia sp. S22 TaxID=3137182 RepID=UPI003530C1B7
MTQKGIGPSFADELAAAGLSGLPFSWTSDGDFTYSESMTADQIAQVQAVYDAHDPTKGSIYANTATRDALLAAAAVAIAPLQDAVDLDIATDGEVAFLKQWKQYRVAVNRVDLTQAAISWPSVPAG